MSPTPSAARRAMAGGLAPLVRALQRLTARLSQALEVQALPEEMDLQDRLRWCLVAERPILRGERIERHMLAARRSRDGLGRQLLDRVQGRKALYDIEAEASITFGLVDFTE